VIAEDLRLFYRKLAPAVPYSDQTRAPRTVVSSRGGLVEMMVAASTSC
jgi:hypothetical protein